MLNIDCCDFEWTPGTLYVFNSYGQFFGTYFECDDGRVMLHNPIFSLHENRPIAYLLFIEAIFEQDEWKILKFMHDGKFIYTSERYTFNVFPVTELYHEQDST